MVVISSQIARFSSYICVYGRYLYTNSFKYPHGRKPGPRGPATVQAMGYPLHENALRRSLTRYTFNRPIVTEQVFKWHGIVAYSVCRLCPVFPFAGKKCFLKCVSPALCHSVESRVGPCRHTVKETRINTM
jgi:hypothetical protein